MHLLLALLLVAAPGATAPTTRWLWPVDPPRVIVRPYLAPATPWGPGHRGIDIESTPHADVYAPADGEVHFAGLVVDRLVISIEHAGGVLSSFEPVFPLVEEGQRVSRGQIIGMLNYEHCRVVSCLHMGVRIGGEYVSPLLFLGGVERGVLLPTREPERGARASATLRRRGAFPRTQPWRARDR